MRTPGTLSKHLLPRKYRRMQICRAIMDPVEFGKVHRQSISRLRMLEETSNRLSPSRKVHLRVFSLYARDRRQGQTWWNRLIYRLRDVPDMDEVLAWIRRVLAAKVCSSQELKRMDHILSSH